MPAAHARTLSADADDRHPRLAAALAAAPVSSRRPCRPGVLVALDAAQANYLGNVMRLKEGDEVLLFDGVSGEWLARVAEAGKKRMIARASAQPTRPQESVPDLALAFAPVKKGRVDWLVEKAVELGVARLQPVITQRTIVDKLNLERMRSPHRRGRRAMRAHQPRRRSPSRSSSTPSCARATRRARSTSPTRPAASRPRPPSRPDRRRS